MTSHPQQHEHQPLLGIDLGSRNVKLCLMHGGDITYQRCIPTIAFYREYGTRSGPGFAMDMQALGIPGKPAAVATGYGRLALSLAGSVQVSELTAHCHGAVYQTGMRDFTLLDLGGQDFKVMKIAGGKIIDMTTNDKCAASTGRFLENMAAVLGIDIDELGRYHESPVDISSTCAIFGESELIGHLVNGTDMRMLAAGVNASVVERIAPHLERLAPETIVMSGGVALNPAVRTLLEKRFGVPCTPVERPFLNGAIGCCDYFLRKHGGAKFRLQ